MKTKNTCLLPVKRINLQITANSISEIFPFLLGKGIPYALTERLNKDVLKEYFGRQRALGRRNDNPTIQQIGYNGDVLFFE